MAPKLYSQKFAIAIFATLACSLMMACGSEPTTSTNVTTQSAASSTATANNPQELKTVRVSLSWLLQGVDAPLMIAMSKGYFQEEGIEVQWERGFGNADTISKLGAGQYDIGFSDMYNMLEFNDKNPNEKLVAIAVAFNKAPFSILTLKKSGIEKPEDLVGKTLGSPAGDGPRRLWPLFAKQVGIDPDSVTWTTMDPKLRETFLVTEEVNAISGFSTSALPNIRKSGVKLEDVNVFYYGDYGLDMYGNAILIRQAFLDQNPEVAKGFVRAYLRGLKDTIENPEAALEVVKAAGDNLIDMEAEKLRLEIALEKLMVNAETQANGLGSVDPKRLEETIRLTVEGFNLSRQPALSEVFDDRFLPPKEERSL
ncbi:ABC transporter substrate-binding protein [Desertifilum sp. FACHB-1129]|uniref:Tat pathway signal protein n=1 Tax=Desertifilum tharense IPPAS B-1220 TaxID=1781255 RepID=A0A1E5QCZ8_9CYAN|nr:MULTISPECIES: ABC transporter substrate-binding protein [Desertifilum]MDA0210396.1 ABC transporter substrate-binding protein [Cyanobacteria bacterium FC1]MBD2313630.1 ABC transporter substrate-binding protein [Desertifilum sp. FACHB-1129]MBD2320625.1 ABC transporter substrate-binding protein [Desertifilum sp. FACHB-866]MBD2330753.1 ABC transporter substrate-binding protein [Desertifilum sp. FACHB-868]OEJ72525.1 Tat pathway signal protein [Desertifilum tharense IPPAS B-1220]